MKKQGGFSLVQLLIVAGMLSGIFVVSLRIMKNQNQMGKSSSEEFEISYIFDDMRNILSDPKACSKTFEGINLMQPSSLDGISSGTDKELEYQTFSSSGKLHGQKNLKITKIEYVVGDQEASVEDGEAFLNVYFEKSRSALGEKIVKKKMKVHLVLDEKNNLSSCFVLPGVNQTREEKQIKESVWFPISGTEDIYTNLEKAAINTSTLPFHKGMSLEGRLKIRNHSKACGSDQLGTLRYFQKRLEVCKKKGWSTVWHSAQNVESKVYTLKAFNKDRRVKTDSSFSYCAIVNPSLYGARCRSRRLSGNLWELSLSYDRGGESTCSIKCFALR